MPTYTDGTFPASSPVLTSAGGVTYKCNSFSIDKGAETVPIIDENGAPSGALQFEGHVTGSAELQFAAIGTAEPAVASANTSNGTYVNVNIAGALSTIFSTGVAISKPQRGPWTATISWQKRVN